jgi:hypothetical protein
MELSKAVAFAALLLVVLLSAGYTLAEGDAGAQSGNAAGPVVARAAR